MQLQAHEYHWTKKVTLETSFLSQQTHSVSCLWVVLSAFLILPALSLFQHACPQLI